MSSFEYQVVTHELKYWGFWKGLQYAADGYSPEDTIAHIMSGSSSNFGHRILCLDMPAKAWDINARIMRLPGDNVAALVGRYCLPLKESGAPYEADEVSKALRISLRTYRYRLTDGRRRYRSMLFGPSLSELTVIASTV